MSFLVLKLYIFKFLQISFQLFISVKQHNHNNLDIQKNIRTNTNFDLGGNKPPLGGETSI